MAQGIGRPNKYRELQKAVLDRQRLLDEARFSISPENGGGSIIFTSGETREDREVLAEHADSLARDQMRGFYGAEIIRQARREDIYDALADTDIASMAFIGDGGLGLINLSLGDDAFERVNWHSLAKHTRHLKLGSTQERTCSGVYNPEKEVRVPLTSFIVADQRLIHGTVDMTFGNHTGYEVFNEHVRPLFEHASNDAEALRRPLQFNLDRSL